MWCLRATRSQQHYVGDLLFRYCLQLKTKPARTDDRQQQTPHLVYTVITSSGWCEMFHMCIITFIPMDEALSVVAGKAACHCSRKV